MGGLAREFYRKLGEHYAIEDFEAKHEDPAVWRFEPHVADSIF